MCSHNQNSIEICSAQQARAGKELLYTETDFSRHMHWQALTGFYSHAGSHVDNVTLLIMLLHQLTENFIFILSSRSNLELLMKYSVTTILLSKRMSAFLLLLCLK